MGRLAFGVVRPVKISIPFRRSGVLIHESMILEATGIKIGNEKLIESQVVREPADDDLNQAAGGSVMQQSTGNENLNPGGVPDASKQDHSGDEPQA